MTDLATVLLGARLLADAADRRYGDLEAAVDRLFAARRDANAALARTHRAYDLSLVMSSFAARAMVGDETPEKIAEVADYIRELVGTDFEVAAKERAA